MVFFSLLISLVYLSPLFTRVRNSCQQLPDKWAKCKICIYIYIYIYIYDHLCNTDGRSHLGASRICFKETTWKTKLRCSMILWDDTNRLFPGLDNISRTVWMVVIWLFYFYWMVIVIICIYIYIYVFIYLFTNVCFLMLLNGRVVVTIWLLHVIKPYIIFTICMVTS